MDFIRLILLSFLNENVPFPARNHRLLAFLFSKAKKGIKKSLAPRFIGRPVKGLKG